MNSSDILQSIFIVVIFILLFLVNILAVGIKNIEDDWPTYRCNPVVMPFAGLFGQDVMSNFNYCIQNIQSNYMSYLSMPMNYNLNIMSNLGGTLSGQINTIRSYTSSIRDSITSTIENVFSVFLNILVQVQVMMAAIKDMMGKLVGITLTQLYLMTGFTDLLNSAWKGPPGQMMRSLEGVCFHKDTKIKTDKGIIKISDIPINAKLENDAIVLSRMIISNLKSDGTYREKLFKIKGKEKDIKVSGSHLIFDPTSNKFMSVKELVEKYPKFGEKLSIKCDILYCLITSNHTIPIDGWLFHDWEDNNGSKSKTLKI